MPQRGSFDLTVQLTSGEPELYAGHRVVARLQHKIAIAADEGTLDSLVVPGEFSGQANASGDARLTLPARKDIEGEVELRLLAPDGEVLGSRRVEAADLEPVLELEVAPKSYFSVDRNDDPAFGKPAQVRGRVIDASGERQVADTQVVLWARADDGDEPARPVSVARTDSRGYFYGEFPAGTYAEAHGIVGAAPATPVPVPLESDGTFPERLVLAIELAESMDDAKAVEPDCHCNDEVPRLPGHEDFAYAAGTFTADLGVGQCVDITKPNRTLEEFDFYSVVRTTEPQIKGLTLTPPAKVGAKTILGLLNPQLYSALAGATQQQSFQLLSSPAPKGVADLGELARILGPKTEPAAVPKQAKHVATAVEKVEIDAPLAKVIADDPDAFSLTKLASAELQTNSKALLNAVELLTKKLPARGVLDIDTEIDWDSEPTFYQACTIAHGHLLHFKQVWKADGYSLGDLLYSLPLAPCQKKQIAVVDWERRESATRQESLEAREDMDAALERDRDISEIAHAALAESVRGGSEAETDSHSLGLGHAGSAGGSFGGMLSMGAGLVGGVAFGGGSASSSAWQKSSRKASADSLQSLRDRTTQAASAVRSQRSTVVQTMRQGETARVTTEVVANHNHCHAITIEYFEVLRHFLVEQDLADVRECLFVPLYMSKFDSAKALRWRAPLSRFLRDRSLRGGFAALERIANNYAGSDMPTGAYADEELDYLDGFLRLEFHLVRPRDDDEGEFDSDAWSPIHELLGISTLEYWKTQLQETEFRDRVFLETLGPQIAQRIANNLKLFLVDENDSEVEIALDSTLVDDFQNDAGLYVSLRLNAALPAISRKAIKFVRIARELKLGDLIADLLAPGSQVMVRSGQMRYRTKHLTHDLFNSSSILNDLSSTDDVRIFTPLSRQELRRPRDEDVDVANRLLKHLNEHFEHYHRVIWRAMDAQRRYMLLDGFIAPNSGGRSVASVVENRLIGIVGNCLVLPIAPGNHLDPTFKQDAEDPIDLLDHYKPPTPPAPLRVSVPTRGVFAESVMGSCNSCEKKDESRFWRFEESPCGDEPTPILPVSTETRRAAPPDLTAKDFPQPIIAMQNAPAAPAPTGFAPLLSLLGTPGLFSDVTGLTENQKNAIAALERAFQSSEYFGGQAAQLAAQAQGGGQKLALQQAMSRDIDKIGSQIEGAHQRNAISDETRSALWESLLRSSMGGGAEAPQGGEKPTDPQKVMEAVQGPLSDGASIGGGEAVYHDVTPNQDLFAKVSYMQQQGGPAGGGAAPATCATFTPQAVDTLVVDSLEFVKPVDDFLNWEPANSVYHGARTPPAGESQCRALDDINAIVLHETATWDDNKSSNRWGGNNLATHFYVQTDGSIVQHYDVVEYLQHAGHRNRHSIGIEFVNKVWAGPNEVANNAFTPPNTALDHTPRELLPSWGALSHYIVPPANQLEALKELLDDLLVLVPAIPWTWLSLDHPEADHLFLMTHWPSIYGCKEASCARGGIYCHFNMGGHTDGSFLALYTWLRQRGLDPGGAAGGAYETAKDLVRNHGVTIGGRRFVDVSAHLP